MEGRKSQHHYEVAGADICLNVVELMIPERLVRFRLSGPLLRDLERLGSVRLR